MVHVYGKHTQELPLFVLYTQYRILSPETEDTNTIVPGDHSSENSGLVPVSSFRLCPSIACVSYPYSTHMEVVFHFVNYYQGPHLNTTANEEFPLSKMCASISQRTLNGRVFFSVGSPTVQVKELILVELTRSLDFSWPRDKNKPLNPSEKDLNCVVHDREWKWHDILLVRHECCQYTGFYLEAWRPIA